MEATSSADRIENNTMELTSNNEYPIFKFKTRSDRILITGDKYISPIQMFCGIPRQTIKTKTIIADCYDMENADQIKIQYNIIKKNNFDLKDIALRIMSIGITDNDAYEKLLKRQNYIHNDIFCTEKIIEQLKIPMFVSETNKHLLEGKSVIIFVAYQQTLKILAKELNTDCVISGGMYQLEINNAVNKFKKDISRVIICTYKLAIGFTLEDQNGDFPRVAIMSSIVIEQVLERINWAESKTPSKQFIMFCKGVEEEMCEKMKEMLLKIDA